MPLRAQKFPTNQREWDAWTRQVEVIPDPQSVNTGLIVDGAITNTKLRSSESTSVIGCSGGIGGPPADIQATVDGQVLVRHADMLIFTALLDADIPATIARTADVTTAITTALGSAASSDQFILAAQMFR